MDPKKAHPATYAVDGTERWWQSPPLSRGLGYNEVNVTLDLGQVRLSYLTPLWTSVYLLLPAVWIMIAVWEKYSTWMLQREEKESVFCFGHCSAAVKWIRSFVQGGRAPSLVWNLKLQDFWHHIPLQCCGLLLVCFGYARQKVVWLMLVHSQIFQRCHTIIFSVWAPLPQPAVIMWIMCCNWKLATNQIHAPLASEYASIMTRVSGRSLAHGP